MNPELNRYVEEIRKSGLTIYDPIEIGDPDLWIPTTELETLLNYGLRGQSLADLPIKTRSKLVKGLACQILGYPVPSSFRKTRPRFPGQLFDIYVQKSNNFQPWNEELIHTRRYVLIRVSDDHVITRVKVVTGDMLALLDTTGTLTQKYQAICTPKAQPTELVVNVDTALLQPFTSSTVDMEYNVTPVNYPFIGQLLSIKSIFDKLTSLIGRQFKNPGYVQERNRGAALHRLVCEALGYARYGDTGRIPDIRHQLLEIKLQTAATIDLGMALPNSTEPLDIPQLQGQQIRYCDIRYAIFYGRTDGEWITLTHLFLTTGEAFFSRFPQTRGREANRKLQIPLPSGFFD